MNLDEKIKELEERVRRLEAHVSKKKEAAGKDMIHLEEPPTKTGRLEDSRNYPFGSSIKNPESVILEPCIAPPLLRVYWIDLLNHHGDVETTQKAGVL